MDLIGCDAGDFTMTVSWDVLECTDFPFTDTFTLTLPITKSKQNPSGEVKCPSKSKQ